MSVSRWFGPRWLRRSCACLALLFSALLAQGQTAPLGEKQALFLDDSGSMRPYYSSGLLHDIAGPLSASITAGSNLQLYSFSTAVLPARNLEAIQSAPFGQYTFLDKVIDACRSGGIDIGWIVTDNIEDTGEAGNTERFYRKLRSDTVRRVTVFPVRSSPGRPGLVIYALLFTDKAAPLYDSTLERFVSEGHGILRTEPLLMKPINQDTVEVTSRDLAPLTRRGGHKIYDTGTPVREAAEVRFRSRLDHIEIVDSSLHILDAKPSFGPESLLVPSERQLSITPDRIRDLGPGRETAQVYHLTANLGELALKPSPLAWWRAAWGHPEEEAELPLTFAIDVPQGNFRLRRPFLDQWSAPTVADARATGKVYALDNLLASINAGDTHIQVTAPLFFRVRYPTWPALLWIALFALALAVLLGLLLASRRLLFRRTPKWAVRAVTPEGQALTATLEKSHITVEGRQVARLEGIDLVPIAPARLAAGQPRIAVVPHQPVRLVHRTQLIDLFFVPASEAAGPTPPAPTTRQAPAYTASSRPTPPTGATPPRRR